MARRVERHNLRGPEVHQVGGGYRSSSLRALLREATSSNAAQLQLEPEGRRQGPLIPGLPDEITVSSILTRLPWTAAYLAVLVSRSWFVAFVSGQVSDARKRARLTQNLIALNCWDDGRLILYNPSENSWHLLPTIPGCTGVDTHGSRCAVFNGKVYVICGYPFGGCGGQDWQCGIRRGGYVYMIDLGRCQANWRHCAEMDHQRTLLTVAVDKHEERIFVFGGMNKDGFIVTSSQEYDCKRDVWTEIPPMEKVQLMQSTLTLELEGTGVNVFHCGGRVWNQHESARSSSVWGQSWECEDSLSASNENSMIVYSSARKEWWEAPNIALGARSQAFFEWNGLLFHVDHHAVYLCCVKSGRRQAIQGQAWGCLQNVCVWSAVAVGRHLFAIVNASPLITATQVFLVQGTGFLSPRRLITWQRVTCNEDIHLRWYKASLNPFTV